MTSNNITVVNFSQQIAPTPSTLQGTGAIISVGGTTLAANTLQLISDLAELTAILAPTDTLASLTWSGGTVTGTTSAAHGWTNGDIIKAVIVGATPSGYNGTQTITITGTTTFTYAHSGTLSNASPAGTVTLLDESELNAEFTTFFGQTPNNSCYVLELGEQDPAAAITSFGTWLTANPNVVYIWLVPFEWDGLSGYLSLLASYNSLGAMTYFWQKTTSGTYTEYAVPTKCLNVMIEAPGVAFPEFSHAADFAVPLNWSPSSSNKVPQIPYAFLFGVTNWPPLNNLSTLATYAAANVNYVGTGAQGNISEQILFRGKMFDGNVFNYWYSADWIQINGAIALTAAVINGNNNRVAPLLYSQQGINTLQQALAAVCRQGIGYGLALGNLITTQLPAAQFQANVAAGLYTGNVVCNAEPFVNYTAENPTAYSSGLYGGLTVIWVIQNGFIQIVFNGQITDIV